MLAIPIMAGSTAYAVAETFKWQEGMELKPLVAKGFYVVISIATIVGIGLGFSSIDPIKALYWSAVVNGVISVPIMIIMVRIASRKQIMGIFVAGKTLKLFGWSAVMIMSIAVITMFLTLLPFRIQ